MRVRGIVVLGIVIVIAACSPEKKAMKSFRYGKYESVISYYKGVLRKQSCANQAARNESRPATLQQVNGAVRPISPRLVVSSVDR